MLDPELHSQYPHWPRVSQTSFGCDLIVWVESQLLYNMCVRTAFAVTKVGLADKTLRAQHFFVLVSFSRQDATPGRNAASDGTQGARLSARELPSLLPHQGMGAIEGGLALQHPEARFRMYQCAFRGLKKNTKCAPRPRHFATRVRPFSNRPTIPMHSRIVKSNSFDS